MQPGLKRLSGRRSEVEAIRVGDWNERCLVTSMEGMPSNSAAACSMKRYIVVYEVPSPACFLLFVTEERSQGTVWLPPALHDGNNQAAYAL